jgi:hypothetical protein
MDPTVVAAWIAAGVSVVTLLGTLAAQYFGRRGTSRDTKEALQEQWKQLDRTLAEQRSQTFNERFATAAEQLGDDKPAAVRLAGVYAMAGLADDWEANRQTCVDVLCAYLRMPYEPDPGEDSPASAQLVFKSSREVRHTVIRVVTAHLQKDAAVSWEGLNFDFRGAVFDGGAFSGAHFSGGTVSFDDAQFSGGEIEFYEAHFSGSTVNFVDAHFSGSTVNFVGTNFSGGIVLFGDAEFSGGEVRFVDAKFSGGLVLFGGGKRFFDGEWVLFGAHFSGGKVSFGGAHFSGGKVSFTGAEFSGGTVDFSLVADWSHRPAFPWTETPPEGVQLPSSRAV